MSGKTVLIAIGGNALYDNVGGDSLDRTQVEEVCRHITQVVKDGYLPVITFGNGPQVGNLLNMAETSARLTATRVTLETCVSWTQGQIGYWLANELHQQLSQAGLHRTILPTITSVEVDPADPAFEKPTKPIGSFIDEALAQELYQTRGWVVGADANRGYRRLVPSPKPSRIVEADALKTLVDNQVIILAGGGGGIPVVQTDEGYRGVEAVIDKDYTSCLLAKTLGIGSLVISTAVECMYLNFGTPEQSPLRQVTVADAKRHLADGQFSDGSMGPKVAAMVDYVETTGGRALITSIPNITAALAGKAGSEILPQ